MKLILSLLVLTSASSSFAANLCTKWGHKPRYVSALKAVATAYKMSYEQLCTHSAILDIEVQPSHIVIPDGTVIPHVQVQLHQSTQSCLIMVNDLDLSITQNYCYSGS
jgi:hypothetical protein